MHSAEATDGRSVRDRTKIVEFLESSVDGDLERFNELLNSFDGSGELFYLDYLQTYKIAFCADCYEEYEAAGENQYGGWSGRIVDTG